MFIVSKEFDGDRISNKKDNIFTVDDFCENPPIEIVRNLFMTNYLIVGPSVGPEKRELVEELVHRTQIRTNTRLTFWETKTSIFIDDFREKINRVLTTLDKDYLKNKNIVLTSAGPSLEG